MPWSPAVPQNLQGVYNKSARRKEKRGKKKKRSSPQKMLVPLRESKREKKREGRGIDIISPERRTKF